MGVLEVSSRLDFGEKSFGPDHGSQFGLQHLQRDLTLVLEIVGQIHGSHPAFTQLSLDGVATFQCCV